LEKARKDSLNIILTHLENFLEGKTTNQSIFNKRDLRILHYYNEIVRNWSKLNFILRKTGRSLEQFGDLNNHEIAKYLFITYRILWEKSSRESMIKEFHILSRDDLKLKEYIEKLKSFSWKKALSGKSKEEKISIIEAIPSFVIERLLPVMSIEFLKRNLQFMNTYDKKTDCVVRICHRSNYLDSQEISKFITEDFKKKNIFTQDPDFPDLFHTPIKNKQKIIKSKWYKSGNIIIQDKGSVSVVKILSPQSNDFICDMCAAPGMKTSLIKEHIKDNGQVFALDFHTGRAYQMKQLLQHLNVQRVHIINTDSIQIPTRNENQFDRVLLDAPCTGSGTFLANPELKWRQNKEFLYQKTVLQKKLLKTAIKILKVDGILVYATCSLYPEEGELIISDFLEELEPLQLLDFFSPSYRINNSTIPGTGRLFPAIHHTQGFFVGKFKKKE